MSNYAIDDAVRGAIAHKKLVILMADDEPDILFMAKFLLEKNPVSEGYGFEIVTVANGEQLVEKYRELHERVAYVLTDFNMPRMNGQQALAQIQNLRRQYESECPFPIGYTMVTSKSEPKESELTVLGGTGKLLKPYAPESLQNIIFDYVMKNRSAFIGESK